MRYTETPFGFDWGAAKVTRAISEPGKGSDGWVTLDIQTARDSIQVYVSSTGKLRVFNLDNSGEWQRPTKEGKR